MEKHPRYYALEQGFAVIDEARKELLQEKPDNQKGNIHLLTIVNTLCYNTKHIWMRKQKQK